MDELLVLCRRVLGDGDRAEEAAAAAAAATPTNDRIVLAAAARACRDRALRVLACRQDSEPLSRQDDEWLLAHLAGCADCGMAHAAMLEASVCYRAWP